MKEAKSVIVNTRIEMSYLCPYCNAEHIEVDDVNEMDSVNISEKMIAMDEGEELTKQCDNCLKTFALKYYKNS